MQTQSSDKNSDYLSVSLSVRLSHTCIVTKQKKDLSRFLYHTSFLRRRMVGRGDPSTWNFGSAGPRWSEIADFEPIFACSASAITSSQKSSINTNRKPTSCFPMCLRWSLYVALTPQMQNGRSPYKFALCLKKVCYKVSCVKTVSSKVVRHSLAWLFVQKWLVGRPLLSK